MDELCDHVIQYLTINFLLYWYYLLLNVSPFYSNYYFKTIIIYLF